MSSPSRGRIYGIDSVASAALLRRALLSITSTYGFGPGLDGESARVTLRVPEQGRIVVQ